MAAVCGLGVSLFAVEHAGGVAGALPPPAARARIDVVVELERLTYQALEPVEGNIILTVSGLPAGAASEAREAVVYLYGDRYPENVARVFNVQTGDVIHTAAEGLATRSEASRQQYYSDLQQQLQANPQWVLREFGVPLRGNGRYVVPIGENGAIIPSVLGGSPVITSGPFYLGVLAVLDDRSSDDPRGFADTLVDVVALLPRLVVRDVALDPASPPPVEHRPFVVTTRYEIEGLPADPAQTVDVRQELSVRNVDPTRPYADSNALTTAVPGSPSGRGSFERRWEVTVPQAGTYDIELDVTAAGFLQSGAAGSNSWDTLTVRVGLASSQPPSQDPAPQGPEWVLSHVVGDPDGLEGKDLGNGSASGLSESGFTVNWDRVHQNSGGYAPNSVMTIGLSGAPPARLRQGDTFQMSMSGTAAKLGPDPADGRQPGEQASGNVGGTPHVSIGATPHSSGITFPDGHDGTAIAVGGYFGSWWPNDGRTYTVEVTAADAPGDLEISFYFPGRGTIARWVYQRADPGQPEPDPAAPAPGPQVAPLDDVANLEAVLDPAAVDVSPRSGISTVVTVMIRGDRPNWKPVEVLFDTVDAWGALAVCKYLKIEGQGSRQTADMWKTNDGYFHWNLNVLANLGISGGTYLVPITVRQDGHGEVKNLLTVRVPPTRRGPPAAGAAPASGGTTGPPVPGTGVPPAPGGTGVERPRWPPWPPTTGTPLPPAVGAAADLALELLRAAVRRNVNSPKVHTDLGLMLLRRGRVDEAREELFKALTLSPTDELCMANFAEVLLASGDEAQAREWAVKAKALGLAHHRVFEALGMR